MKVNIYEDAACAEVEITIRCRQADAKMEALVAFLHTFDRRLTGRKGDQTLFVEVAHVLYFESVNKKTFLYTSGDVLEVALRLYELEGVLADSSFVRASKSCIVNLARVASLRPDFGGRIQLTLENGERIIASRQYSGELKQKLGL